MIVQCKEEADPKALPMVNTLGVIKVMAGSEQTNTWPTPIFDQDQIGEFTLALCSGVTELVYKSGVDTEQAEEVVMIGKEL